MVYCISDIHDVIDRYLGGVDLLKEVMENQNMVMLLGNHEQMCLDTLGPYNVWGSKSLWQQNGGSSTYRELLYVRTSSERRKIINFLLKLPDHLDITVSGQKFHLVHGFPSDNPDNRIWDRPSIDMPAPLEGCTAIVGHTPTCYMTGNHEEVFKIWHGDGVIDIDCGCGNKPEFRRLACLRLDDMEEFYV